LPVIEPLRREADTCTSEEEGCTRTFEAGVGTRMSELEADTCTSEEAADSSIPEQEAGIRESQMEADTRVFEAEAGRCILAEAADSTLPEPEGHRTAGQHSSGRARRRCMQPEASERSSMTSLVTP
jgi:hypothetical protein